MCVPFNSRSTAWASFDGRGRVELKRALLYSHASVHRRPKLCYQRVITLRLQRAGFRSLPFAPTNSQQTGSTPSRALSSGTNVSDKSLLSSSRRVASRRSITIISARTITSPQPLRVKEMRRKTKTTPTKRRKRSTLTTFRLRTVVTLHPPPQTVGAPISGYPRESHLCPVRHLVLQRQSWV